MEKAWFDSIAQVQGKNSIRDAILEIVNARGEITKGMLLEEVKDKTKNQTPPPGINKIRTLIGEMVTVTLRIGRGKKGNTHLIMTPSYQRESYENV